MTSGPVRWMCHVSSLPTLGGWQVPGRLSRRVSPAVKARVVFSLVFVFSFGFGPTSAGAVTEVVDEIVAVVEGTPVLRSDLRALRASLVQQGESGLDDAELIEARIDELLMTAWAAQQQIDVDDRQIDSTVRNIAEQNGMSVEGLYEAVQAQGLSPVAYRDMLRTQLLRMQIIQQEIEPSISIDDADLIAWMREHPERYGLEPMIAIRAGDERQRVELPWSSLDPVVQRWISENPAPGATTEVVRDGVPMTIEFEAVRQAALPALDEVRDEVYAEVRRDRIERAFAQWMGQRRANAWIERR